MSKRKSPNKARPVPAPVPAGPPPVLEGNVFARFIAEASSIGNEVTARRALQAEVAEYLASKGLAEDFEAWRRARTAVAPTAQG